MIQEDRAGHSATRGGGVKAVHQLLQGLRGELAKMFGQGPVRHAFNGRLAERGDQRPVAGVVSSQHEGGQQIIARFRLLAMLQLPADSRHGRDGDRLGAGQVREQRVRPCAQVHAPVTRRRGARRLPHQFELVVVPGDDLAITFRQPPAVPFFRAQIVIVRLGHRLRRQKKCLVIQQRRVDVRAQRLLAGARQPPSRNEQRDAD